MPQVQQMKFCPTDVSQAGIAMLKEVLWTTGRCYKKLKLVS